MPDPFGDRLYAISRQLGYTNNTAFAARIGTTPSETQRLLEKMFRPRWPKVQQIADRLGIPVEALTVDVRTADQPRPPLAAHVGRMLAPEVAMPFPDRRRA